MGMIDRGGDGYDSGDDNDGIEDEPGQGADHRVASDRRMMTAVGFGACDERTANGTDGAEDDRSLPTRRCVERAN